MKIYKLEEFIPGEFVYHKTNIKQTMLVIEAHKESNKVEVSFMNDGISRRDSFDPIELVKREDLPPPPRRIIK